MSLVHPVGGFRRFAECRRASERKAHSRRPRNGEPGCCKGFAEFQIVVIVFVVEFVYLFGDLFGGRAHTHPRANRIRQNVRYLEVVLISRIPGRVVLALRSVKYSVT